MAKSKDSPLFSFIVFCNHMTRTKAQGNVSNTDFLLLEIVNFSKFWEKWYQLAKFLTEAKLSHFIRPVQKDMSLIRHDGRVEISSMNRRNLIEE